jgi:secreted trypsin-like serine protease
MTFRTFSSARFALSLAGLLTVFVGARPAEAIINRHDRTEAQYIALGALPQFAPVGGVFIFGTDPNTGQNFGLGGTATLITPEWILTAAHVVDRNGINFGSSTNFYSSLGTHQLAEVVVHPNWTGNIENGHDIALVRLAQPITGITPAQLFTGTNALTFGSTAMNAGNGAVGDGLTGPNGNPVTALHAMENDADTYATFTSSTSVNLSSISGSYILQDFDHPNNPLLNFSGSSTPDDLEGMIAPGDSGGPLMVDVGGGNWQVAGVHSFITNTGNVPNSPQAVYGWIAGSTSITDNLGFINSTINASANAPEPVSLALLLPGTMTALLLRRRNRK